MPPAGISDTTGLEATPTGTNSIRSCCDAPSWTVLLHDFSTAFACSFRSNSCCHWDAGRHSTSKYIDHQRRYVSSTPSASYCSRSGLNAHEWWVYLLLSSKRSSAD